MTLQDEEAVRSAETENSGQIEEASAAESTKADRIKVDYDDAAGTVSLTAAGSNPATYSLDGIPDAPLRRLALIGLSRAVQQSKDVPKLLERMRAGEMPGRVPAAPKTKPVNDWLKAYASAKVEATKKTDAPLTIEAATEMAAALTKEQVASIKTNPLVVKHYAKITGASSELI